MTSRENAEYGARRRGLKGAAKRKWIESNIDADPVLPMTGKADVPKPKPKVKRKA